MQVVFYCGDITEAIDLSTIKRHKSIAGELRDWLKKNKLEHTNNNAGFYYSSN